MMMTNEELIDQEAEEQEAEIEAHEKEKIRMKSPVKRKRRENFRTTNSLIPIQMFSDGRMDAKNAALYLGVTRHTLESMRSLGKSPPFIKVVKHVYYYQADLDAWLKNKSKKTCSKNKEDLQGWQRFCKDIGKAWKRFITKKETIK